MSKQEEICSDHMLLISCIESRSRERAQQTLLSKTLETSKADTTQAIQKIRIYV